jgi:hypothetical protein
MLDHFLEAAIRADAVKNNSVKLAQDLKNLPVETLYGLATGREKLAFGHDADWLDKYRGTTLFEQALMLEKADLENEVARGQADAMRPQMDKFYQTSDQIRIQKRMLDLKLAELQESVSMLPGGQLPETVGPMDTAQGAGALGDVPSEGVQADPMGVNGAKTAGLLDKTKNLTGYAALRNAAEHHGTVKRIKQELGSLSDPENLVEQVLQGAHKATLGSKINEAQASRAKSLREGIPKALGTTAVLSGAAYGGKKLYDRGKQTAMSGGQEKTALLSEVLSGAVGQHYGGQREDVRDGAARGGLGAFTGTQSQEPEKTAALVRHFLEATKSGLALEKEASIGTLGKGVLQFAKSRPGIAGAALGSVGGAVMAPRDAYGNKQYLSGALKGGLMGAAGGSLIGKVHGNYSPSGGVLGALKTTGEQGLNAAKNYGAGLSNDFRAAFPKATPVAVRSTGAG